MKRIISILIENKPGALARVVGLFHQRGYNIETLNVGPVFDGDPIFPKYKVEFYGQPLFAVAATSTELARKAVLKAKILYNGY